MTSPQAAPFANWPQLGVGIVVVSPARFVTSSNRGAMTVGFDTAKTAGVPDGRPSTDATTRNVPSDENHCDGVTATRVAARPLPGTISFAS